MKGLLYLAIIVAGVFMTWTNREKFIHLLSKPGSAEVESTEVTDSPETPSETTASPATATAATATAATATPHPAHQAQARATALYPGLTIPNSGLNQKFVALYKDAQANDPALLSQPDWPLTLADRAAVALGGAPMPRTRFTAAATAPAPFFASAPAAKQVVIYTTAHCPYCVKAKQYLAQKGVSYKEVNVEASATGKAEFRRLGGHGVPLIMVGDTKVNGFNQKELDRLL